MPAHSDEFPWPGHYGHFDFFENKMKTHHNVESLESCGEGLYVLQRRSGNPLNVFICECYAFGVAQYMETVQNLGTLDAIIINSIWCGYSMDAKIHCQQQKVGLYSIKDFMVALNREDIWNYLNESERDQLQKNGCV